MSCWDKTLLFTVSFFVAGNALLAADGKSVWYTHFNASSDNSQTPRDEITYSPASHSFSPPEAFIWTVFMGFDGESISGYQVPVYREQNGLMNSLPGSFLRQEVEFTPTTIDSVNGALFYGGDFAGADAIRAKYHFLPGEPVWLSGHNLKVVRKTK